MALDELKEDLMEADADIRSYLECSGKYLKLKVFKNYMRIITLSAKIMLIGTTLLLALFFFSMAASYFLGDVLHNLFYGFMLTALFYGIAGLVFYVFRNRLNKPLLRKLSEYYFEEP